MADVKDGDIVFEYPDDDEIPGNKIPDEKEVSLKDTEVSARKEKNEVSIETKANDIDLEIDEIDDTPAQDRNREPLPKEVVNELENDNLDDYSERVKQRLAQMKKVWHDERRVKEAAEREKDEAIKFAQQIAAENKQLKSTLSSGEATYIETLKSAIEQQLHLAKRDYREAYDSGETDKIIDAQQRMNDAQLRLSQANNYVTQYEKPLQDSKNDVYIPQLQSQPQTQAFKPDSKALAWQEKNDWFGSDEEMTSLALGVHEKLVRSGINPTSDEYYRRINSTMQKRFPEYFGDATLDEDQPAQRTKPSNVVAPATRSTAPKKVRLTKTQVALAKKFGLTPEQYARETLKLENANG